MTIDAYQELYQYLEGFNAKFIYVSVYQNKGESAYYLIAPKVEGSEDYTLLETQLKPENLDVEYEAMLKDGEYVTDIYERSKEKRITVVAPIAVMTDDEIVALAIDYNATDILVSIKRFKVMLKGILALLCLVQIIGISIGTSYFVKRPIAGIRQLINATAQFDFKALEGAEIGLQSNNEIGEMTQEVLSMRKALNEKASITQTVVSSLLDIVGKMQNEINHSTYNTKVVNLQDKQTY
ncbi:hypothetical protein [Cellulosilyticum ruminicola]|uniref:hypothetical protein n=1 Tax=Cellulosilyticum ruminicola TaxID=425254 RepID=UPI0006D17A1B|nr:hypothetical protein [Cellulosilyticum ruminicola]